MASKLLMSVEEYLHTSFEAADCEYVDGEIVERNMGQTLHGTIQLWLGHMLLVLSTKLGIRSAVEVRIRISASRYRIPDISVWRAETDIGEEIPKAPPFLAIEILSPDDRAIRMLEKIQEYFAAGVEWVWIIDPYERKAMICSHSNPAPQTSDVLRTENPAIEIALSEALSPLT
jgi:Uma2 family endonuclease